MESDEGDVTIDDGDDKESNESSTENLPNDNNLIEVQIEEAGDSTHEAAEPLSVREISVTVEEPETEIVVKEPASIPNVETPAPSQRKKLRSPRLEVVEDDGL